MSDLLRELGVSGKRVVLDPLPGTATVRELVRFNDTKVNDRLYELVDGTLVEKTVGLRESYWRHCWLRNLFISCVQASVE